MLTDLKVKMNKRFDMKDLGEIKYCLGLQVIRNRKQGTIRLTQLKYVEGILKRFDMANCKPVTTPFEGKISKDMSPKNQEDLDEMKNVPYQSAVGSLMYAMLGTRPDISFAVGAVSQYSSNLGKEHWKAVKRIFCYLKGTLDYALEYSGSDQAVHGYSNADWARNIDDHHSTTGYAFLLNRGAISWASKKQLMVALSTTEAEYMALAQVTKEAIWIRRFLSEINTDLPTKMIVYSDNQSAISLCRNSTFHARTKHIDIRHHFLREKVESGELEISFCGTEDMTADILTKGLCREKHRKFSEGMGIQND